MAKVRVFGYGGIVQLQQQLMKQHGQANVFMRQEPYQWREALTLAGATPQNTPVQTEDSLTTLIVVEVDDDTQVRYEITLSGTLVEADADSPKLVGTNVFQWVRGARFSVIDAAGT